MKLDTTALIFAIVGAGLWVILMLTSVIMAGPAGFILLIPMLIGGYFIGMVVAQRLASREDDYYDKVEK